MPLTEKIIVTSYVTIFVCLLPVILGWKLNREGNLPNVLQSTLFHNVLLVSVGATLPCIFDLFLDFAFTQLRRSVYLSRSTVLFALIGPNILTYFYGEYEWGPELFTCLGVVQQVLFVYGMLAYLVAEESSKVTGIWVTRVLYAVSLQTVPVALQPFTHSSFIYYSSFLAYVAFVLEIVAINVYVVYQGVSSTQQRTGSMHARYSLLCAWCTCSNLLIKTVIGILLARRDYVDISVYEVIAFHTVDAVCILVAAVIPGRIARDEAAVGKV